MSFIEITAVLGNLGEFIGAIAVVVTLFYLALQVKHSKEATEANTKALDEGRKLTLSQTYQANIAMDCEWLLRMADSPVAEIEVKYRESGVNALDAVERLRMKAFYSAELKQKQNAHFAKRRGLLDMSDDAFAVYAVSRRRIWQDFQFMTPSSLGEAAEKSWFWEDVRSAWEEQDKKR